MYKNMKILIVQDNKDINKLLYKRLNNEGYRVTSAYSGTEVKICLEKENYELILLDLMIPGITGENLIEYIREIKIMPIVVVSVKSGQEDKINVLKLGADDFVSKPFDINEILARVEAQLRRYTKFSKNSEKKTY